MGEYEDLTNGGWLDRGHYINRKAGARSTVSRLSRRYPHTEYRAVLRPGRGDYTILSRARPVEPVTLVAALEVGGADVSYYARVTLDTELMLRLAHLRQALLEAQDERPNSAIDGLIAGSGWIEFFDYDDQSEEVQEALDAVQNEWQQLPGVELGDTAGEDGERLEVHTTGVWWACYIGRFHCETPVIEWGALEMHLRGEKPWAVDEEVA